MERNYTPHKYGGRTGGARGGRGRALWMVGDQEYKVQVIRTPLEEALTWTNDALAAAG